MLEREGINTLTVAPLQRQRRGSSACWRCTTIGPTTGGRRPGTPRAARGPGRDRHPQRAELQPHGDLGGAAPVDPAARHAADPAAQRSTRSARPSASSSTSSSTTTTSASIASRATTACRSPGAARSASTTARTATSSASRSARASPAGWPATASPSTCGDAAARSRARRRSRAPRTTSTSRCCSRRCCYEDEVIGVIVLSKLGLDQFGADDLRFLEIYASIAGPGDGQRRCHRAAARPVGGARAPARQPARAAARDRVDPVARSTRQTVVEEIAERLQTLVPRRQPRGRRP